MDTASMIREFLDENHIRGSRSVEIVYRYHAELEPGCRLNGCEMTMRSVGNEVIVRAELPINVMTKETRGVVRYLADLNKKRIGEGKNGYFDLDYVAGKIVFAIRVLQPITPDLLKKVAHYCVGQIEYESDDLLKVVCEECEAALQEEEELRQQQEKERNKSKSFGSLIGRFRDWLDDIIEPGSSRRRRKTAASDDDPYDEYMFDYNFDDDEPSRCSQTRRPHFAKAPAFDMEDEEEKADETEPMAEKPQPEAEPAAESEEKDPYVPEWVPAEGSEEEQALNDMTDDEFVEHLLKRFSSDGEDVIYVPPTENDDEAEEPQTEEPLDEEASGSETDQTPESQPAEEKITEE